MTSWRAYWKRNGTWSAAECTVYEVNETPVNVDIVRDIARDKAVRDKLQAELNAQASHEKWEREQLDKLKKKYEGT